MFVAKAGPDVGAGGGGAAPAGGAPSGGGAPAPAAPPPQGAGVGTPVAPAQTSQPSTGGEFYEWTEPVDGKPQTFRAKHEAVRSAFRREQHLNRRFSEFQEEKKEADRIRAADAARRQAELEGRIELPKEWSRDQRIKYLANILKGDLDAEKQELDPEKRDLLRRANEGDEATKRLRAIEQQREEAAQAERVAQRKEEMASEFGEALKVFKLPKNDLTLALMAQAQGDAREEGWGVTPQALAESTHGLVAETMEGLVAHCYKDDGRGGQMLDDEACVAMLERFPKFERAIHRGLLVRHEQRKRAATGVVQQQPPPKTEERKPEAPVAPKLMNSAEEAKAYGIRGLRTV